jgi:hypothetical protein
MAKYDKYDPISGGFRAILAADLVLTNGAFFGAVSLNASGLVVAGTAGQSGCVGVVVKNVARGPVTQWATTTLGAANAAAPIGAMAGDVVDIMTSGEINDLDPAVFVAGTKFYAQANGSISTSGGTGKVLVGHTVEAGRLIVRVAQNLAILP